MDASQLRGLEELQTEVKDTLGQLPAETRSHAITSIRGVLTGLRQSQTIEEIVHGNAGHRQKEVLAMLSSLGSVLRHDLPIVTAAMLAEIDEAPLFGKGLHVVSTGEDGEVVKGIIDEFDSSDNQCRVIQTDGSLSDWIKSKDIVLDDEASKDNGKILNHLREGKTKNVQDVKQQIMSDFDELCADMAKGDKAHWYGSTKHHCFLCACDALVGNIEAAFLMTSVCTEQAGRGFQLQTDIDQGHRLQARPSEAVCQGNCCDDSR